MSKKSLILAILVFSLAFASTVVVPASGPAVYAQTEEHQDPPPDPGSGGGGSGCTYCSSTNCG